jgi:predicted transcriptional regulator
LTKPNFQIYISSKILASILNNTLNFLRKYAVRCKLFEFCKGFVIKVILGDGTAVINKDLTNLTIAISEIDKDAQKDLVSMFKLFSVNSRIYRNKVIVSTDFYSCIWFLENNLFEGHEENRMKFLKYIINNHFFGTLYKRLKTINSIITVEEFAKENNLRTDTARMYLDRNIKRGFIKRAGKGLYEISVTGKKFITLYESALSQYLIALKRGL